MDSRDASTSGLYSGRQIRDAALLLVTGFVLYLSWLVAEPFLAGITWALALAVVAYPLNSRLQRWSGPNTAALFSVVLVVVVLLAPGVFFFQKAFQEASNSVGAFSQTFDSTRLHALAARYPSVSAAFDWLAARFNPDQELSRAAGILAGQASAVLGGSIELVTQIVIMLVTLFYFLRDHQSLLDYVRRLVPLTSPETDQLLARMAEAISATLYGNVAVKIVQGILGGWIFWVLGLPSPVLCGMAMALFALLPVVGTAIIWGPAAIFLMVQGSWGKAIILVLVGSLVISLIDNVLYPLVIAGQLRIHALGVFLAVLGGLVAFGLAGVVLGPVILAVATALLEIWSQRAAVGPVPSNP